MKRWMVVAALVAVLWTAPVAEAGGGGRFAVGFAVQRRPVVVRSFAVQVGSGYNYGLRGVTSFGLGYSQPVFARRAFFTPSYGYVPRQAFYGPAVGFDAYGGGCGTPSGLYRQFAPFAPGCGY